MARRMAIIVHGGAGTHSAIVHDSMDRKILEDGVKAAVKEGWKVLSDGGSAMDAVEAAVVSMENDVAFNAGKYILIITQSQVIHIHLKFIIPCCTRSNL